MISLNHDSSMFLPCLWKQKQLSPILPFPTIHRARSPHDESPHSLFHRQHYHIHHSMHFYIVEIVVNHPEWVDHLLCNDSFLGERQSSLWSYYEWGRDASNRSWDCLNQSWFTDDNIRPVGWPFPRSYWPHLQTHLRLVDDVDRFDGLIV